MRKTKNTKEEMQRDLERIKELTEQIRLTSQEIVKLENVEKWSRPALIAVLFGLPLAIIAGITQNLVYEVIVMTISVIAMAIMCGCWAYLILKRVK